MPLRQEGGSNILNRENLTVYIKDIYNCKEDRPWAKYPDYVVFRHLGNRKWFALIMNIPKSRIGLPGDDMIDVVNLKCDPVLIGSLLQEDGFYPAYHMNKVYWITAALDGTASDDKIKMVLDMSFEATAVKVKKTDKHDR